ncbi:DUF6522 family protein [Sinorhizobium terangae]|uniref:Uncharacterized protein n=1 Tax=Sinorhizobium terangae TaxID=110322 RepID=A0A6N7LBB8_SINTE|nr:DUF6522 family protein [Sinorhizobium terangae]MBB4188604.1 hypothetical protein [Sinorhizobium terangae]MQX14590.1 hypothetical protein [Sinorhizobium terangae]WFU49823.1 DUF6522 family protein [Sinorhizobium terangae]
MYIERNQSGDFILESSELAERFGLSSDEFRQHLRRGSVMSMVERGEAEDAGTCRLSVRLGNRMWRAILDDQGRVASEEMTILRSRGRP